MATRSELIKPETLSFIRRILRLIRTITRGLDAVVADLNDEGADNDSA